MPTPKNIPAPDPDAIAFAGGLTRTIVPAKHKGIATHGNEGTAPQVHTEGPALDGESLVRAVPEEHRAAFQLLIDEMNRMRGEASSRAALQGTLKVDPPTPSAPPLPALFHDALMQVAGPYLHYLDSKRQGGDSQPVAVLRAITQNVGGFTEADAMAALKAAAEVGRNQYQHHQHCAPQENITRFLRRYA